MRIDGETILFLVCISLIMIAFLCIMDGIRRGKEECEHKGGVIVGHIGCVNQEEYKRLMIK